MAMLEWNTHRQQVTVRIGELRSLAPAQGQSRPDRHQAAARHGASRERSLRRSVLRPPSMPAPDLGHVCRSLLLLFMKAPTRTDMQSRPRTQTLEGS